MPPFALKLCHHSPTTLVRKIFQVISLQSMQLWSTDAITYFLKVAQGDSCHSNSRSSCNSQVIRGRNFVILLQYSFIISVFLPKLICDRHFYIPYRDNCQKSKNQRRIPFPSMLADLIQRALVIHRLKSFEVKFLGLEA